MKFIKKFSQNFLINKYLINLITNLIKPISNSQIIEIGPGNGALTYNILLNYFKYNIPISAVELDENFYFKLKNNFININIINENILNLNFKNLIKNNINQFNKSKFHIIGNLPYNISSLILFHLLNFIKIIHNQYFMLQKEFVERITAVHNTKNFSRLSIILQCFYKIEKLIIVNSKSFHPPPNIDSYFIKMEPLKIFLIKFSDLNLLNNLLKLIFNNRRKILKNSLKNYSKYINFDKLKINLNFRPENLSIDKYINLLYEFKKNNLINK